MCCFSRPVEFVGKTQIYARSLPRSEQALVYTMDVAFDEPLAMVLPLPVPPSPSEDAVRFVSLEGYPRFFDDLGAAFPPDYLTAPQAKGGLFRGGPELSAKLEVHDVGDFEASFVPTSRDFARLDARFRLPDDVLGRLPAYADFGFAVFRLKPKKRGLFGLGAATQSVHPMAFVFPRRDPRSLFFPTLHVHDGHVAASAPFDHTLYLQDDDVLGATLGWTRSKGPLGAHLRVDRTVGLIDGAHVGLRQGIVGTFPNRDVVLTPPEGVTLGELSGEGHGFTFRAQATHAYLTGEIDDARRARWATSAREKLGALCRALRESLPTVVSAHATCALSPELPAHFMNGPHLWRGTSYMDGAPAKPGGPGALTLRVFTEHVEPQEICLGFRALPDPATLAALFARLQGVLDRAVA